MAFLRGDYAGIVLKLNVVCVCLWLPGKGELRRPLALRAGFATKRCETPVLGRLWLNVRYESL